MAFKYDRTANQQTPTSDSKVVLCKSFKIDIANGSGFLSGTTYDLGWLPKDAQVVDAKCVVTTAVSGGTVSAATLAIAVGSYNVFGSQNVFTTASSNMYGITYYTNLGVQTTDQKVTYTPALTGAGATAGVIYINIFYVV